MDTEKIKKEAFEKNGLLESIRYIRRETGLDLRQAIDLFEKWKSEGMKLKDCTEEILAKENFDLKAENERLSRLNKELVKALEGLLDSINPHSSPGKTWKETDWSQPIRPFSEYYIGSVNMPEGKPIYEAIQILNNTKNKQP